MSKYFDNINTQVTRNKFGSNYGKKITDKNLIPVTERKKENKQEALLEASKKHMEISKNAQRKQIDKIKDQREFRKVLNESYDKIKDDLFCNILHHICLEALCIDEQPMYENMENISNRINQKYKELGGFKAIKEQAKRTDNVLLERMISICENTAKKVADRNLKECDSADGFKFELTDEEKNDFEYNKDNINIDSIASKIKNKVIKVVSDEKEANTKKTEIMDEIQDKLKEDEVDEEATEEAMQFVFHENIETTSLFEALMRECYKITLETPKDLIFESYVKENSEEDLDDPEYKLSELDSYDDNNVMTDEVANDLMISESFTEQLPINKLRELEDYISEGVRIRTKPGNLGFYSDYDTGVADIIQSAKKREHVAKSILQPGFRENIMNLIKVAKHGPDVAYINQLAKLPFRLFGKNGKTVKVLEDYQEWLNTEYKEAYLETLNNLGISINIIPEFKQSLVSYQPMSDVFTEHARGILEAVQDGDYEQLDKNLKDTSKDMKKVAEDCGKSKKNLTSCKESIREIQKSTEELKDESKNNKLAKEACSASTISKSKEDLSEMLVCPVCEKDPCECETDEVVNEYTVNSNINSTVNRKVYNRQIDAHGSINYNKLAAAGAVAGVAGAVYGKYKLDEHGIKKLCQREIGYNGKMAGWQKKIMKRIRKAKKAKDVVEVKITVKNDMNALKKGLKKNPDYKVMINNQLKWYNDVAMKGILAREREFSITEEDYNNINVDEGYLFEDYYNDVEYMLYEDDGYDDDDAEDEDIKKYLKEEDDDEIEGVEEGVPGILYALDSLPSKEDMTEYYIDEYRGHYEEIKNEWKEDINYAIQYYNNKPNKLKQCIKHIKKSEKEVKEEINDQRRVLRYMRKNYYASNEIREVEDYVKWLETEAMDMIKANKTTLGVKESFEFDEDYDDIIEEGLGSAIKSKIISAMKKSHNKTVALNSKGKYETTKNAIAVKIQHTTMKEEIDFLLKDLNNTIKEAEEIRDTVLNDKTLAFNKKDRADIEDYVKWLKSEYPKLLKKRKQELASSKSIGESCCLESKQYKCMSCGYIVEGEAPEYCPECGNDGDQFKYCEETIKEKPSIDEKTLKKAMEEQSDFEQDFVYGKDRAIYENKDYHNSLYVKEPSNMRKYCLLKKINEASSFKDLDKVKEYINEEVKEYKQNTDYVKWLKESATNATILKHVVLEENIVIESFLNSLDDICDMLDKRLDSHDEAKQAALESMYTDFNGSNVFAPIFKASDVNSNNIEFAYKVKFLCEGLKGLTKDCENNADLAQANRLVTRNMETLDTIMESIDNSTYKYDMLGKAKNYLEKLSNHISVINEAYIMESSNIFDEETVTEAVNMTDELYDNAINDDIMYNTRNSHMDLVMAEAITKYTIMETFNTLRLTNLTNQDIEKIVRNIVK